MKFAPPWAATGRGQTPEPAGAGRHTDRRERDALILRPPAGCPRKALHSSGGATRTTALGRQRFRPMQTAASALSRFKRFPAPPLGAGRRRHSSGGGLSLIHISEPTSLALI
eukprot:12507563-Alexandrium_andersonii.AAC.1